MSENCFRRDGGKSPGELYRTVHMRNNGVEPLAQTFRDFLLILGSDNYCCAKTRSFFCKGSQQGFTASIGVNVLAIEAVCLAEFFREIVVVRQPFKLVMP